MKKIVQFQEVSVIEGTIYSAKCNTALIFLTERLTKKFADLL
jgi:hypothetical protein